MQDVVSSNAFSPCCYAATRIVPATSAGTYLERRDRRPHKFRFIVEPAELSGRLTHLTPTETLFYLTSLFCSLVPRLFR